MPFLKGLKSFEKLLLRSVVPLTISFFYPNPYHIRRKSVSSILLDASSI